MSPRYPGGPRPSLRMPNQPPGGIPGSQPLLPNSLDPTRPQGEVTGSHSVTLRREVRVEGGEGGGEDGGDERVEVMRGWRRS
ncbi:hypothetical protein NHX12_019992 [Muraenolepis orangiensis]|uniref:Uncharacterized protein n=1 Tax=Muraenolepis orangiensis TaxID=630683 RepID=A0A9Q0EUL1_9TELE|nr:hypothetical protein NHX12_019992 [Muraenolepis orangiensis]